MVIIGLVASIAALLVSLITLAAVVEIFANVATIQDGLGQGEGSRLEVLEELTKTIISRNPQEVGLDLPAGSPAWYVLFVSQHCSMCHRILQSLSEQAPLSTSVVVLGVTSEEGSTWLAAIDRELPELQVSPDAQLFEGIGLSLTPTVMVVIDSEMAFMAAVDSIEALKRITVEKYLPPQVLAMRAGAENS